MVMLRKLLRSADRAQSSTGYAGKRPWGPDQESSRFLVIRAGKKLPRAKASARRARARILESSGRAESSADQGHLVLTAGRSLGRSQLSSQADVSSRNQVMDGQPSAQSHLSGMRRSSRLAAHQRGEHDLGDATIVDWEDHSFPFSDCKGSQGSDRSSVGLESSKPDLQPSTSQDIPQQSCTAPASAPGYWKMLPTELTEAILKLCSPPQMGMLQTSCSYFSKLKLIDQIAKHKLTQFVKCQSAAAAQATAVSCGAYHTSALMIPEKKKASYNGIRHTLYSFGRGFHGQLGNTSYQDEKRPETPQVEEEIMPAVVACGAHYSSAISRRGELFTWGLGCNGELGQGRWTPLEVNLPRQCLLPQVRIVSVTCGANHTLAVGESGTLWSCGKNYHGQLGLGNLLESFCLCMVQNLQGYRIVSAAAGASHSMALTSDGSLFTWGEGGRGQLGHSQLQQVAAVVPVNNPITVPVPQKISRLDPAILEPGQRVTAIAAGSFHGMALTVGGRVLAFGANSHGCLGLGDTQNRWKPTKVPLELDGEQGHCIRVVQLVCGTNHSVALVSKDGRLEVRTTGCNTWGQLGQGDRQQRTRFTPTAYTNCPVAVQAGEHHTAAVSSTGGLYLWGRGDCGQLGLGDNRAKWKPTLMRNFTVVHPDKTLRRNKRSQPFTRLAQDQPPQSKRQCMFEASPLM
eukprot:gene23798-9361_t